MGAVLCADACLHRQAFVSASDDDVCHRWESSTLDPVELSSVCVWTEVSRA